MLAGFEGVEVASQKWQTGVVMPVAAKGGLLEPSPRLSRREGASGLSGKLISLFFITLSFALYTELMMFSAVLFYLNGLAQCSLRASIN